MNDMGVFEENGDIVLCSKSKEGSARNLDSKEAR
jgi:hypothetical protein